MVAFSTSQGLIDLTVNRKYSNKLSQTTYFTPQHVGIYVGFIKRRHRMVHNLNGVGVEMRDLETLMIGKYWWVRKDQDGALTGPEVAKRAIIA
jgi:hypothetical protein